MSAIGDCDLRVGKTIHHLNDRLMRKVLQHLSLLDLSSFADVCSSFKNIAQKEFSSRYEDGYFDISVQNGDENRSGMRKCLIPPQRLASVLRNFGPLINSSEMHFDDSLKTQAKRAIEMVKKGCGEAVDEHGMRNVKFFVSVIAETAKLSSGMGMLHFYRSEFQQFSINYERAELFEFHLWFSIDRVLFTEELMGFGMKSIKDFLEMNPELKISEVTVNNSRVINRTTCIIPKIEEMTFTYKNDADEEIIEDDGDEEWEDIEDDEDDSDDEEDFPYLHPLKSLKIDFRYTPFSGLICDLALYNIPLESLKLWRFISDEMLVKSTAKLKKLKKLELIDGDNMKLSDVVEILEKVGEISELNLQLAGILPANLVEVVRCAPKLGELKYTPNDWNWTFDENLFQEMLKVVAEREVKSRLTIEMPARMLDVPEKLQETHAHLLQINATKQNY